MGRGQVRTRTEGRHRGSKYPVSRRDTSRRGGILNVPIDLSKIPYAVAVDRPGEWAVVGPTGFVVNRFPYNYKNKTGKLASARADARKMNIVANMPRGERYMLRLLARTEDGLVDGDTAFRTVDYRLTKSYLKGSKPNEEFWAHMIMYNGVNSSVDALARAGLVYKRDWHVYAYTGNIHGKRRIVLTKKGREYAEMAMQDNFARPEAWNK